MGLIKKEGYLTKSPPERKMGNRGSWCRRYFVLLEIGYNDKMKMRGFDENDNNNNNNNNNTCDNYNNNTTIGNPRLTELSTNNFNKNSSIEIYLMYWDDLAVKMKGREPKGFYLEMFTRYSLFFSRNVIMLVLRFSGINLPKCP